MLPARLLARLLPVPLTALRPVRVRISTFEARMKLTELCTSVGAAERARLDDRVADIVDEIDVVAEAAAHRVGAGLAVECVAAAIADQDVGQRLPVPLIAAMPVRLRFSTFAPSK